MNLYFEMSNEKIIRDNVFIKFNFLLLFEKCFHKTYIFVIN